MEDNLDAWASSLMGDVESDFHALLNKIGSEAAGEDADADALDQCSWLWKNIADEYEPMDMGASVDAPQPLIRHAEYIASMGPPVPSYEAPVYNPFKGASFSSALGDSGALPLSSALSAAFHQPPYTFLGGPSPGRSRLVHQSSPEVPMAGAKPSETNPMLDPYLHHVLADLLKSDEFLSAVTAHGKRLQHNLPAPVIQASLAKDLSGARGCLLSKKKRRVSGAGSGSGSGSGRLSKSSSGKLSDHLMPSSEPAISKRDTTSRKKQEIAKLEQEVREKLIMVRVLEEEKEKILNREEAVHAKAQNLGSWIADSSCQQLPVSITSPLSTKQPSTNATSISQTIVAMIDTFRSHAGRAKATDVLKGFTTSVQFTIKEYCGILCSFLEELNDIVKQQESLSGKEESLDSELHPQVSTRLNIVVPKIESFVHAAIVIHAPLTLYSLSCDIRDPSVTLIRDTAFWTSVREKMHLTTLQEANLHSIYQMYATLMQKETDNAARVLAEIIVNSQQSDRDAFSELACDTNTVRSNCDLMESLHSFQAVNQRFMILSSMLTSLIMTSLSPWQKALMCTLSYPSAPDVKLIMATLCHKMKEVHRNL